MPIAVVLAYMYFVHRKTAPPEIPASTDTASVPAALDPDGGGDKAIGGCKTCPINRTVPTTPIAPPSEHCNEDLRPTNVRHPDDAVRAYQAQQQAFQLRKLNNPELDPIKRAIKA